MCMHLCVDESLHAAELFAMFIVDWREKSNGFVVQKVFAHRMLLFALKWYAVSMFVV